MKMGSISMRRFFFDDGKSRKAWQIELQGKKQTVQFGRIGTSLRESVKIFATPTEAAEATNKLIVTKTTEGYVEIDARRLELSRPRTHQLAEKKAVLAFEKSLGLKLPDDFITFLLTTNGGTLSEWYIRTPAVRSIDNVIVSELYGLLPEKNRLSIDAALRRYGPSLPKGHLPVARGNDLFSLCLTGKYTGAVMFWNHETVRSDDEKAFAETDGHLIAGSFEEFLTRIASFYDESKAVGTSKTEKKSVNKNPNFRKLFRLIDRPHNDQTACMIADEIAAQGGDLTGIKDRELPFNNFKHAGVLRVLLKANLNPKLTDVEGHPLIFLAAASAPCIDLLVKAGADVDQRDYDGWTPLMRAFFLESKLCVKKLLALGANPNVSMPTTRTSGYNDAALREIVAKAKADRKTKRTSK